jgi:2-polyprenyl-3-methyl-5-hydroxy-6-metoxy-1,4-benzoquinol methylase
MLSLQQLIETQRAFDNIAPVYDGPIGNNALVQKMRAQLWRAVEGEISPGARVLDLGCGTGIDAVHFAQRGYRVFASDWSARMVERTRARVAENGVSDRVEVSRIGIHELERLRGERFDGIYSDLGALNCVSDLRDVARCCSMLLCHKGVLIASVIGRICLWEFGYYAARGKWQRAKLRGARESVPVNLGGETVWTRYYAPREFYRAFAHEFHLAGYRGLNLFLPPPYLIGMYEKFRAPFRAATWLDEHLATLPVLREWGDHFLMALRKRD